MQRWVFLIAIGLAGAAVLIGLGIWQLQRLEWKQGVLSEIDSRITAPAVAVPENPSEETDKYLPVETDGVVFPSELHVLVSIKNKGAGYRVVSPFELPDGRRIMVDRGFVPAAEKMVDRTQGRQRVTGNLHWPQEVDSYTPEPDLTNNTWFARDVTAMAEALDTLPVLLIVRTTSQPIPSITPLPVDSAGIPNDHLQYAITWFSLAAIWLAMTGFFLRGSREQTES